MSEPTDTLGGESLSTAPTTIRYDNDGDTASQATFQSGWGGTRDHPLLFKVKGTPPSPKFPSGVGSVYTTATDNTFKPPNIRNSEFDAFQSRAVDQTPVVNLNSFDFDDVEYTKASKQGLFDQPKPPPPKRNLMRFCLLLSVVLLATAGVGAFFVLQSNDENDVDFCLEFDTTDTEVRQFLAENFDAAVVNGGNDINFNGFGDIPCLPNNAFAALNSAQVSVFQSAIALFFQRVNLQKVAPDAFDSAAVNNIVFVDLLGNSLTELPDGVFAPFAALDQVVFNENDFVTLNNNLFAADNSVINLFFDACNRLREIPEVIQFTPRLQVLGLNNLQINIGGVNAAVFDGLEEITQIQIINTPLANDNGVEFATLIGVDLSVIVFQNSL